MAMRKSPLPGRIVVRDQATALIFSIVAVTILITAYALSLASCRDSVMKRGLAQPTAVLGP
jgi:hypothetical protein